MSQNKTYKSFPNFNDVQEPALQAWNRCAIMFNIMNDHGKELAAEYAEQFNNYDRTRVLMMSNYIAAKGYEAVRAEINRGEHAGAFH